MKITEITLGGWRSYSNSEPIQLTDLKKVNLIIGPNNSGKSNLAKFFLMFKTLFEKVPGSSISSEGLRNILTPKSGSSDSLDDIDFWDRRIKTVKAKILFAELPKLFSKGVYPQDLFNQTGNSISLNLRTRPKEPTPGDSKITHWNTEIILRIDDEIPFQKVDADVETFFTGKVKEKAHFSKNLPSTEKPQENEKAVLNEILNSLVFIDAVRHHSNAIPQQNFWFNGGDTKNKIVNIQRDRNRTEYWDEYKTKIENWMKSILDEPKLEIEVSSGEVRFRLIRGGRVRIQYFDHLGWGVAQLFMLLSHLYLNRDRSIIVFMDEPENNLHPQSVQRLLEILEHDDFENHQYFISSHSAPVIDAVNENWTIHRTTLPYETGTRFIPCTSLVEKHHLLNELGIRASQILQTNLVIWVEGPSDMIYLKRWINIFRPEFQEGRHFSFLFYGGTLMKYLGASSEGIENNIETFVDLFHTSRYSIVLFDSDKSSERQSTKTLAEQFKERVKQNPELAKRVLIKETWGREIENFIPLHLWQTIEEAPELVRSYLFETVKENTREKINLVFSKPLQKLDRYEDFSKWLSACYSRGDEQELSEGQVLRIRHSMDGLKAKLATHFTKRWQENDFEMQEPLKVLVQELATMIGKASNLVPAQKTGPNSL